MSALAPSSSVDVVTPRPLVVRRDRLTIEGHELAQLELGGYAIGPELGTAPIIVVVGGITASPFPFTGADAWWPALAADDLVDPACQTVLAPCWPGNGSTWRGFEDGPLPQLSAAGLADLIAAWLDGIGVAAPVTYLGASLGGMVGVALAARHPERVGRLVAVSAALRPDGWGTAVRYLQRELVHDGLRTGDLAASMGARAPARDPDLSRARGARHPVRHARAGARSAAGRRLSRSPRPRVRARFPVRTFLLLS